MAAAETFMIDIVVNGVARQVPGVLSVLEVLGHLGVDPARVAVELNREILPKGDYPATSLKEGDSIEIVHFVGGG